MAQNKYVHEFIALFKEKLGMMLEKEFAREVPIDTGLLYQSLTYTVVGKKIKIIMPEYAMYLEYGTGIYIPGGERIVSKSGKSMPIQTPQGTIFRGSIAGMPAQPFVRPIFHNKLNGLVKYAALQTGMELGQKYGGSNKNN